MPGWLLARRNMLSGGAPCALCAAQASQGVEQRSEVQEGGASRGGQGRCGLAASGEDKEPRWRLLPTP